MSGRLSAEALSGRAGPVRLLPQQMNELSQEMAVLHSQRYSDPCSIASIALVIPRHQCDRSGAGCLPPWSPGTASSCLP